VDGQPDERDRGNVGRTAVVATENGAPNCSVAGAAVIVRLRYSREEIRRRINLRVRVIGLDATRAAARESTRASGRRLSWSGTSSDCIDAVVL